MVRLKTQELANYVTGRRSELNFEGPKTVLKRPDSEAIRNLILSSAKADAKKVGIRRNTLWYLRQRARSGKFFSIYAKLKPKLP